MVATAATLRSAAGRGPSTGRPRWVAVPSSSRTQASTPSSCAGRTRQPGRPCGAERQPVPAADQLPAVHRGVAEGGPEVRAGAGPDVQAAVVVAPGHQLAARDDAAERAPRPHLAAARQHEPAPGRPGARPSSAAWIRPGCASAQVGRWSAHAGRRRRRRGLTGRSARSFTNPTLVCHAVDLRLAALTTSGLDSAASASAGVRRHSHWLRRKTRNSPAQIVTIVSSTTG